MLDCFCKDKIFLKFYIMFFCFFYVFLNVGDLRPVLLSWGLCNYIVYVINVRFTEFYVMK